MCVIWNGTSKLFYGLTGKINMRTLTRTHTLNRISNRLIVSETY